MLGQLHDAGNTTTLSHYLHLLDTAGLLAGLDKFSPNKIRQRASSPKLQVHNTALMSAQYPEPFEKLRGRPAEWGRWVESAVGAHLLNAMLNSDLKLMYWRHSNDEVDFVLQKGENVIGIEVKSPEGSGLRKTRSAQWEKRTGGMQAFSKNFSPEKVLLVGDDGLAWQEFLELNPSDLF